MYSTNSHIKKAKVPPRQILLPFAERKTDVPQLKLGQLATRQITGEMPEKWNFSSASTEKSLSAHALSC